MNLQREVYCDTSIDHGMVERRGLKLSADISVEVGAQKEPE